MDQKTCYSCHEPAAYPAHVCPHCHTKFGFGFLGFIGSGMNEDGIARRPVGAVISWWLNLIGYFGMALLAGLFLLFLFNQAFHDWVFSLVKR